MVSASHVSSWPYGNRAARTGRSSSTASGILRIIHPAATILKQIFIKLTAVTCPSNREGSGQPRGGSGLSRFFWAPKPPYLASNTIAFENLLLLLAFKSSRWSCAGRRHAEPTAAKTSLGAIAMYMCGGARSRPRRVPGVRVHLQLYSPSSPLTPDEP